MLTSSHSPIKSRNVTSILFSISILIQGDMRNIRINSTEHSVVIIFGEPVSKKHHHFQSS